MAFQSFFSSPFAPLVLANETDFILHFSGLKTCASEIITSQHIFDIENKNTSAVFCFALEKVNKI